MLTLWHHDCECHIHLLIPFMKLWKLITAVHEEFPMLEYLGIGPLTFTFPTGASLLPMAGTGLVTLLLVDIPLSPYFYPDNFL